MIGHRVREEIGRCIDSIRAHAGVEVEVTVVDNGSRDGSVEWLRAEYPDVRVIELERNVFGTARNSALTGGTGRYTLFLDSDAELTPGALPAMVDALDSNPSWGLVGPRLEYPDGGLQFSCRRFPPRSLPLRRRPPFGYLLERSQAVRHHLMEDEPHDRARPVLYLIGACHLFRTCLAEPNGGLDPAFGWGGEDIDWCIRIWDSGSEVVYLPQARVIHGYRRRSKSSPVSLTALRHLRSFARLQWKYRARRRELIGFGAELDGREGILPG